MGKDVEFQLPQPLEIDLGFPDTITVDMGLDDINVQLSGSFNMDMGLDDVNVDLGLDNINAKVDMGLDNINVCMSMSLKELPSMKMHFPMNYEFGLELFGLKVFNFGINGKSMIITEDNPTRLFYRPAPKNAAGVAVQKSEEGFKISIGENQ